MFSSTTNQPYDAPGLRGSRSALGRPARGRSGPSREIARGDTSVSLTYAWGSSARPRGRWTSRAASEASRYATR